MTDERSDVVDQCSLYSVFIESIVFDKTTIDKTLVLSKATASIYFQNGRYYLVTNWHVLSGRNPITFKVLDKNCALPEAIRVYFPKDGKIGCSKKIDFPLKNEEDRFNWLEHSRKHEIDVALLPLNIESTFGVSLVNEINESRGINVFPEYFYVGQEVFVLGFPLGVKGGGGFPIWKKATIASEPYLETNDNHLKIYIDTATREGMSGSPVVFTGPPSGSVRLDGKLQAIMVRPNKLFLGVYSGRIMGEDEFSAQLGVVWKEQAIREILESGGRYREV